MSKKKCKNQVSKITEEQEDIVYNNMMLETETGMILLGILKGYPGAHYDSKLDYLFEGDRTYYQLQ